MGFDYGRTSVSAAFTLTSLTAAPDQASKFRVREMLAAAAGCLDHLIQHKSAVIDSVGLIAKCARTLEREGTLARARRHKKTRGQ